jgi:hypothetical protein
MHVSIVFSAGATVRASRGVTPTFDLHDKRYQHDETFFFSPTTSSEPFFLSELGSW